METISPFIEMGNEEGQVCSSATPYIFKMKQSLMYVFNYGSFSNLIPYQTYSTFCPNNLQQIEIGEKGRNWKGLIMGILTLDQPS